MTDEEIRLMKEELKKEQKQDGVWNWFAVIDKLAGGDITKYEAVEKQNFILCLTTLSYWDFKEKKIAKMQEQARTEQKTIK